MARGDSVDIGGTGGLELAPALAVTGLIPQTSLPVPFAKPVPSAAPDALLSGAAEADGALLARELETARTIQESLLPKTFPALPGFQLAAFCKSARQIGGDFYDAFPLRHDCALLVVADVMGKGVPAALFASTLRTLVRTMSQWTERPADILSRINRVMFEELSSVDMFITAQIAVADAAAGTLTVGNAGHCPLLLADPSGRVQPVSAVGMPLGILKEAVFTQLEVPLEQGSCALLYTDGLVEARNASGEVFGQDRIETWLKAGLAAHDSATELKGRILKDLTAFRGPLPAGDDQTFLLLAPEPAQQHALAA